MEHFTFGLEWFIYGFVSGYFAYPIWKLLTKIYSEAKIAKDEWRNPQ
jgi:hypothetical protein